VKTKGLIKYGVINFEGKTKGLMKVNTIKFEGKIKGLKIILLTSKGKLWV
jgi:hypothetical protein